MTKGAAIKFIRQARNLNQRELAERSGITQPHLSMIEKSIKRNPSEELINRIAEQLNVEPWVFSLLSMPDKKEEFRNSRMANNGGVKAMFDLKLLVCVHYDLPVWKAIG